jgi:hypothetical protein
VIEAEEEDLLSRVDMLGELDTRFRDRGCNGDCGNEVERLTAFLAEALTRSFEDPCRRIELGAGDFMASLRVLRVALMISVARIDLSFGDNWFLFSPVSSSDAIFLVLDFGATDFAGLCFDDVIDFVGFFEFVAGVACWISALGSKRLLSSVAVAGVQVDVEPTAARIESAVVCREAITIQNAEYDNAKCYRRLHIIKMPTRKESIVEELWPERTFVESTEGMVGPATSRRIEIPMWGNSVTSSPQTFVTDI